MMLEEILQYLNNWFVADVKTGTYTVQDGRIDLDFLQDGQLYRITGSMYHDGLHKWVDDLKPIDETFDGAIWILAVPAAVITLAGEISEWNANNPAGPYSSESFGGYSYSKLASKSGGALTWRDVFYDRLAPYRKLLETAPRGAQSYPGTPYRKPFNPDYPYED